MPTLPGIGSRSNTHADTPLADPRPQGSASASSRRGASSSPLRTGLAPRERKERQTLTPDDRQLAGYLRGRVALNKAIDGGELTDMKKGQASLTRTRANLVPANIVAADMQLNVGAYARQNTAVEFLRQLRMTMERTLDQPESTFPLKNVIPLEEMQELGGADRGGKLDVGDHMLTAGVALYARAGVCDMFSRAEEASHASKLGSNQTMVVMGSDQPFPHAWMQVRDTSSERQDIVHDGWAEGPVVLAEDARRPSDRRETPSPIGRTLNQIESRVFARGVAKVIGALQAMPHIAVNFRNRSEQKKAMLEQFIASPEGDVGKLLGISHSMPVLSDEFVDLLQASLRKMDEAGAPRAGLMHAIQSAGVGRAMDLDVHFATDQGNIDDINAAMHETIDVVIRANALRPA